MGSPNAKIKAEPVDPGSFLSSPRPQVKKRGHTIAIEISSDEEETATPTPKAKR